MSVRRAVRVVGFTGVWLAELDVLDTFEKIQVCVEYKDDKPVYKEYEGWVESISNINNYEDLPENAKIYIKAIQEFLNVPIDIVSNGPGREENIVIKKIF